MTTNDLCACCEMRGSHAPECLYARILARPTPALYKSLSAASSSLPATLEWLESEGIDAFCAHVEQPPLLDGISAVVLVNGRSAWRVGELLSVHSESFDGYTTGYAVAPTGALITFVQGEDRGGGGGGKRGPMPAPRVPSDSPVLSSRNQEP